MSDITDEKITTYGEIKKRLRAKIPDKMISHKPVKNQQIPYVNVTDIKDLLDERVGADHWDSVRVSDCVAGDTYICWVRIRIHAQDGIFEQDGVGDENLVVKGYGSVSTNAYAQAFRRAAEGHGLARELWRGELSEEQMHQPATADQVQALHQQVKRLGKTEESAAKYYTKNRVDLFGEMTQDEAERALQHLKTLAAKK